MDKNNMDASIRSGASTSPSSEEQRTKMIQQTIQERLDELQRVTEAHRKIWMDVDRLTKELQQLSESKDEPLFRRYLGVESSHLVTLAHDVNDACSRFDKGIEFVQQCVKLRSNDPKVKWAYSDECVPVLNEDETMPVRFGSIMGDCLRYNTHVSEITIYFEQLVGPEDDDRTKKTNVDALLQYIENSSVLRKVTLLRMDDFPDSDYYVTMFINAIARNQHIIELDCSMCYSMIPAEAFCELLTESKSITTLSVCCGLDWEACAAERMARVEAPQSWGMTQSLVNLRIWLIDDGLIQALNFWESGNFHLEKLTLDENVHEGEDLISVSQLLQRTTTLQHLAFTNFQFGPHDADCIFDGLRQHHSRSLETYVTKLSFLVFSFRNDDAARRFLEYFQTPSPHLHEAAQLKELHVHFNAIEILGMPVGSFIASMVTTPMSSGESTRQIHQQQVESRAPRESTEYCKTVGSHVQVLSIHWFRRMTGFCETMLSNANANCLRSLHLSRFDEKDLSRLFTCLPRMSSVRELHLEVDTSMFLQYCDRVLKMVEQNESLQVVTVVDQDKSPVLNDGQIRLVKSFCQRNIVLGSIRSREVH